MNRDANGRFLPGNSAATGYGRPPKRQELATLDAIRTSFPPERVTALLEEALDLARKTNSARGILAVTETILAYGVGKPATMPDEDSGDLGTYILGLLQPKPAEPPAIEGEADSF